MNDSPKIFGVATVGSKGQIVIPLEARKALNIKAGDKLIIISGPPHNKRLISLAPEDEFAKLLSIFEQHITSMKQEFSKQVTPKGGETND